MMRNSYRTCILASLLLTVTVSAAQASPMKFLQRTKEKLNRMAKAGASDAKMKKIVNQLLDYEMLAKRTLKKHWPTLTEQQRTTFQTTFQALLEKSYVKGLRTDAKYTVVYKTEQVHGATATVVTQVTAIKKGRPREVDVSYKMRRVKGRWVIFDVITDDVSMERNYRDMFNRIIGKQGFPALIRKLKKKAGIP